MVAKGILESSPQEDTDRTYLFITLTMETETEQTRQAPETAPNHTQEIQACESLLRQAWSCIDNQKSPSEIRSELETIAEQFPPQGNKALETFDALAARVADLTGEPQPEWLRTALLGKPSEYLSVQLTSTAIVLNIPNELFSEIRPKSNGITIGDQALPEDLRGRIILMPDPRRPQHEITLRHEMIHSIEAWTPPIGLCATSAYDVIRMATTQEQALEQIALMGFFPRSRAQSEVVAYMGSGGAASSLESYGLKEARQEWSLVFKGLALNTSLSLVEKAALLERATERYRRSMLDAVALSLGFEDLARTVGVETAVARTLVQGHGDPDHALINSRAELLSRRLEGLLDRVSINSNLSEWMTPEWERLAQDVLVCPHPMIVPLVVEVIHRSGLPILLYDFIQVFERAIEWNPESLADVNIERLRARLNHLAAGKDPLFAYVQKPAENLLECLTNGTLLLTPFDAGESHPYVRIGQALLAETPTSELIHLLTEVYCDRHPIWNEISRGIVYEKGRVATDADKIGVNLAIAEHSSDEQDVVWAVISLRHSMEDGKLQESHLATLKRFVPNLPKVEKVSWYSDTTKEWYQQAVERLSTRMSV